MKVSQQRKKQPVQETPHDDNWCDLQLVYVLKDPTVRGDPEIFYVGRTKHLLDRYIAHVKDVEGESAKAERMRLITARERLPIIEVIHEACSDEEAAESESYWIHYYLAAGVPLTNATVSLSHRTKAAKQHYLLDQWAETYYRRDNWLRRWLDNLFKRDDFEIRYKQVL